MKIPITTKDIVVRRLRWVVLFVMIADAVFTLIGQPPIFWHDPKQAEEADPIVRFFLVRGIIPGVVVGTLYVVGALFVASILPRRLGLALLFFLLLGHVGGAKSWFYHFFTETFWWQSLFDLCVAAMIALAVCKPGVTGDEESSDTRPGIVKLLDERFMKTPSIIWISVMAVLCLTSIWLSGLKMARESGARDFMALLGDKFVLDNLRANNVTNAIARLESSEEIELFRIMSYEPTLRGAERHALDKILVSIAQDRARYRKPSIISTNQEPLFQQIASDWAKREIEIDNFLNNIAK